MRNVARPTLKRVDHRGTFIQVLNGTPWRNLSYGRMKKHAVMGNHYHRRTTVFFFLSAGAAEISTIHVKTKRHTRVVLRANQGLRLKPWECHRIRYLKDSSFILVKSHPYRVSAPDTYSYDADCD